MLFADVFFCFPNVSCLGILLNFVLLTLDGNVMNRLIPYYIALLAACFCCLASSAQESFRQRRFSVNDGLSQGIVQDILQDRNGYIWFSTWNGLNKYDGYKFRSFKSHPGEDAALSSNRIVELRETASGDIWCRTQERRAYLFDSQTETFVDVLKPYMLENPSLHIDKIVCLENGVTWLLSFGSAICFRVDENRLGTEEAVRMYDEDTKGWHAGRVTQVKLDTDGDEWVLTDLGVNIVGKKRMESDFPFQYMTEKGGHTWLISSDGQFARYDEAGSVHFMEQAGGVKRVHQMKAISDTLLTVGTDAGLWLVHIPEGTMERVDVRTSTQSSADVLTVFKDSERRLWMFTEGPGIVMYDMDRKACSHLQPPVSHEMTSSEHPFVYEDAMGVIRVNPRGGYLSYYDPEENVLKPYINPDGSILKTSIRVFLIDRQRNVWYGAARNLYHVSFFHDNVDYLPGLANVEARCLFVDSARGLWVATKDARLRLYRGGDVDAAPLYLGTDGRLSSRPVKFFGNVYSMMQDADGFLWIGTRGQGLVQARPSGGHYALRRFLMDAKDEYSISSNDIYALCQDRKGHIWVGTYQGGLNLLQADGERYRFIHGGNRLKNYPFPYAKSKVRTIAETSDGTILVGASEGLLIFSSDFERPESIKFRLHTAEYEHADGMTCTEVMNVRATREGVFLATSTGGFNQILSDDLLTDTLRVRSMGVRDGWMSDLALSVLESEEGDIWFVTENYLIRYNHQTRQQEHYGSSFFHDEVFFSEAVPVVLPDGCLLFSTIGHGPFILSPQKLQEKTYMPPLVFTGLRVRGHEKPYPLDNLDSIVLQPDERFVTFQFAALDYSNASSIQYAYRLRGLDKDWNYSGTLRSANYNNLPPGHYVFELRSTNSDGVWTSQLKSLDVIIEPTFRETPWAWLLYAVAFTVAALLVAYILFYIYRLRHKVDVEQQLSEAKLRFFTDISHELRTPLTLVVSPIEEVLTHESGLSSTSRTHLELARKNVNRMLKLVNQLLDFRKIQSRKMKLVVEEVEVVGFLERVCDNFRPLAQEHAMTFRFEHAMPALRAWIDSDKLEKICYNLLSNAFKYTEDGGTVVLALTEDDKAFDISVRDTGIGISPEKKDRLFERFETLVSRSWSQPSSGIGLSLVKELVELHHGTIGVQSVLGQGSVFTVHLLKGKAHLEKDTQVEFVLDDSSSEESDEVLNSSEALDDEPEAEEVMSVLVVEDNDELRSFLNSILAEHYKVYLAANGREGLELVRAQSPDLIVSDVMMPVMDGLEMVKLIKADPAYCHIPIILLTAKSSLEDRIAGVEQGVDDYITKPFSASYLKAKIQNLLDKRRQWQEMFRKTLLQKGQSEYRPVDLHITSFDQEFMKRLLAFLEENMGDVNLKVEQIADAMNLSRAVFYTKLKTISGLSPIDFLRDIRIKRACQLIASGNYTFSQVAYMVGFKDPKFFSRTFRKIMGCSPTEYKERLQAGGE